MKFSIETEINSHFFFLMWKYFEKTISLLLVFLEEKRLVRYTLILSVLFHLSKGLVWYTPYWIVVLIYLLTFWNSIMKLKTLRKFCQKMHANKSSLINTFKKFINNMLIQRSQTPTVPKNELIIILLYLVKMSQIVKTRLTKTMIKHEIL